jgi:hypothetical protein
MSHVSGHIIIDLVLPHDPHETEEAPDERARVEPCVRLSLGDACSETECVEAARRAYRKLMRRA